MAYITTAERIGLERGRQEGLVQGRQEGRSIVLSLLTYKFNTIPESYCTKVQQADPEMLTNWGKRILEKETLEEVFED